MYYSKGNYEALDRPRKPSSVNKKSAYLVGAGLGSLAAAAFLVRDGQMAGSCSHRAFGSGQILFGAGENPIALTRLTRPSRTEGSSSTIDTKAAPDIRPSADDTAMVALGGRPKPIRRGLVRP